MVLLEKDGYGIKRGCVQLSTTDDSAESEWQPV